MTGIPFYQHDLGQAELDAIAQVFAGPILTTGAVTERFESEFAAFLRRKHALAVSSCTGALHLSLLAFGIGAGDEVITTPLTFIASSTAIMEAGARPVFVDVEPDTGNLDLASVRAAITTRTRAILPVHLYGQMCDMRGLRALADEHGIRVIEDAAHCVEGSRDGIRPGQLGDSACFSFYATKNLTCGEGGALVCNDDATAQRLRLLRLHGMTKTAFDRSREGYQHWDMTALGWKYNLDNIHAAMLVTGLSRLADNAKRRTALAERYDDALADITGVSRPKTLDGVDHAHHLYTVWVDPAQRDRVIAELHQRGIGVVVNYRPIHLLSYFRDQLGYPRGSFPNAERIGDSTLSLPFYPSLPLESADRVAAALGEILDRR
jgi:UDP-4-amino-4-deoxy-L-arabinose-oxoglutarate aminotransferase